MTKTQSTFSVVAVTLLLLAMFPMFSQPSAVAQSEGGVSGACVAFGQCFLASADSCVAGFGQWYGEGTFCTGDTPCSPLFGCPPASTACCLGDGTCAVLITELCVEAGGTSVFGDLPTPCSAVTCPQPCVADLDGDTVVGINDFLDLLAAWGPCP